MKKTEKISAPAIGKTISLRVLGTDVTLTNAIHVQAARDLGIDIQFDIMDGISAQQKAGIQPNSFDIFDQWFHSVDIVWLAKTVQPIDIRRIKLWGDVNDLTKVGQLHPDAKIGRGDAPSKKLYVQADGRLGSNP
jgi:putative spermidine/putrescine transport system substrate-binding protein